ncbi:hypothetical protein BY996DRAFT_6557377 [Phakopsora pachyrhizi]|uniref:Expressed protein n=1 Tax=Phakopsora pachyrhizi TaxID=170000 RepID=A0AAV0B287_PHAPC|nr:hypothetical protein BY996DRAFT_6557377 [Phakopsora pachyrhizi]CAH7677071.1 expressed protein [Phakopsora pachyrhizi]
MPKFELIGVEYLSLPFGRCRLEIMARIFMIFFAFFQSAHGQRQRNDLPDNGLRVLPADLERVYPTSLPLAVITIDDQGGNSKVLSTSFTLLVIFIIFFTISFGFLNWRRKRQDDALLSSVGWTICKKTARRSWSSGPQLELGFTKSSPVPWFSALDFSGEKLETVWEQDSKDDLIPKADLLPEIKSEDERGINEKENRDEFIIAQESKSIETKLEGPGLSAVSKDSKPKLNSKAYFAEAYKKRIGLAPQFLPVKSSLKSKPKQKLESKKEEQNCKSEGVNEKINQGKVKGKKEAARANLDNLREKQDSKSF